MKTSALLLLSLSLAAAGPAFAQCATAAKPMAEAGGAPHSMVKAAEIKWGPGPDSLPSNVQFAVMSGDPAGTGPFAIRLKAPAGFKVPRHWHPADEQVTIIEGDFHLSMGEAGKAHDADFVAGDYVNLPMKMQHAASTKNGVIVQVNSTGPFQVIYVDPKDDPRNAKKAAAK